MYFFLKTHIQFEKKLKLIWKKLDSIFKKKKTKKKAKFYFKRAKFNVQTINKIEICFEEGYIQFAKKLKLDFKKAKIQFNPSPCYATAPTWPLWTYASLKLVVKNMQNQNLNLAHTELLLEHQRFIVSTKFAFWIIFS